MDAISSAAPAPNQVPAHLRPIVDQMGVIEHWMDNVLAQSPQGQQIVRDYAETAPLVMQALDDDPNVMSVVNEMMTKYIMPTTNAINEGDYKTALQRYFMLMQYASQFAARLQQDPEVESMLEQTASKDQAMAENPGAVDELLGQESTYNPQAEGNAGSTATQPAAMSSAQQYSPPNNPGTVGAPAPPAAVAPGGAPTGGGMPMQPPMASPISKIKRRGL